MRARELDRETRVANDRDTIIKADVRTMSDGRVQLRRHDRKSWKTVNRVHFIEKSGLSGYMPDHIDVSDSWDSCVESLTQVLELSGRQARELRQDGWIDLDSLANGAEYASILTCSCDDPMSHSEEREEWRKDEWRELGYYKDSSLKTKVCTDCGAPLRPDDWALCVRCVEDSSRAADSEMSEPNDDLNVSRISGDYLDR